MAPQTDTRQQILECAIRLLGTRGPNGLTAGNLASELGISKATVFHHFPTLAQIPHEAFELLFQDFVDWAPPKDASLKQVLDTLGNLTFRMLEERGDFLRAYYVFFGNAMFDEQLRARLARYVSLVQARIAEHLVQVGVPKRKSKERAKMVVMLLDGIALHRFVSDDPGELRRVWAAFSRLIAEEAS